MRFHWTLFGLALLSVGSLAAEEKAITDSVVRISATRLQPNLVQPWTKSAPNEAFGTGFVIEGQRLLTNAHVVAYASQLYVQPSGSSERVAATIAAISTEMDLALLKVDDASFFDNRPPLLLDEDLPKIKLPVNVYGFPVGGEQISVTEGILSRIDYGNFSTDAQGMRLQIDAALNPGNSGGPALSAGKVIGVAFQTLQKAENVGYLIPADEVRLFLQDMQDGHYDGKPRLHGELQTVENDALRLKLGLPKGVGGVLVNRFPAILDMPLRANDVMTHIGDVPIDSSGRVRLNAEISMPLNYIVPKVARDGKLPVTIWRDKQSLQLDIPVSTTETMLIMSLRGTQPSYFIIGPLVFGRVTREFLAAYSNFTGVLLARANPAVIRVFDSPSFPGEELVAITSPMFSHKITKGYSQPTSAIVQLVNGVQVKNLTHLVELVRDAQGEFIEFQFYDRTERLIFRLDELRDSTEEILSDNGIRKQFSDDLAKYWK